MLVLSATYLHSVLVNTSQHKHSIVIIYDGSLKLMKKIKVGEQILQILEASWLTTLRGAIGAQTQQDPGTVWR